MRTLYGAGTSSAGLSTQLATSPPTPQSATTPPATRAAVLRIAKRTSRPPKMSSARPHCSGNGRLLRMCAIKQRSGQTGATVKKIVGVTSLGSKG